MATVATNGFRDFVSMILYIYVLACIQQQLQQINEIQ